MSDPVITLGNRLYAFRYAEAIFDWDIVIIKSIRAGKTMRFSLRFYYYSGINYGGDPVFSEKINIFCDG